MKGQTDIIKKKDIFIITNNMTIVKNVAIDENLDEKLLLFYVK